MWNPWAAALRVCHFLQGAVLDNWVAQVRARLSPFTVRAPEETHRRACVCQGRHGGVAIPWDWSVDTLRRHHEWKTTQTSIAVIQFASRWFFFFCLLGQTLGTQNRLDKRQSAAGVPAVYAATILSGRCGWHVAERVFKVLVPHFKKVLIEMLQDSCQEHMFFCKYHARRNKFERFQGFFGIT